MTVKIVMRVRRTLVTGFAAVACALGLVAVAAPVADAASGPIFTVMNTSETLPDGVWFRNSPHTADTSRITGLGVYRNEQVQLQCYALGDAVGPYNDSLWYYVNDVTRPTNNGQANAGFLNADYINDGKNANQVDAGVPACVNNGPPASPPPGSTPTVRWLKALPHPPVTGMRLRLPVSPATHRYPSAAVTAQAPTASILSRLLRTPSARHSLRATAIRVMGLITGWLLMGWSRTMFPGEALQAAGEVARRRRMGEQGVVKDLGVEPSRYL